MAAAAVTETIKRNVGSAPATDAYLAWNAPGVERVQDDEEAKARRIAETMNKMQGHNFDQVRMCLALYIHLDQHSENMQGF